MRAPASTPFHNGEQQFSLLVAKLKKMVTGETEAPLSLHFDFILQKTLLFFVEMATKGYATLKGAVSVTQRKKHSSSLMSSVIPTSIYSILHRPPKIEIML